MISPKACEHVQLTSSLLFMISRGHQPSPLKDAAEKLPELLLLGVSETLVHY